MTIVPLFCNGNDPIVPKTGVGSIAPTISTVAMHLSAYRRVDGVMLPHQIDTSLDGKASEAWTIDSFKVNPKVKANAFQKPAK